ncbi:hypothetical protein CF326_g3458 [Tilletia indica]|nr:hypothetical protein CF326_g3458 [Tilletia indica]
MRPPVRIQVPIAAYDNLPNLQNARTQIRLIVASAIENFEVELVDAPNRFEVFQIGLDIRDHIDSAKTALSAIIFGTYLAWRARAFWGQVPDALRSDAVDHFGQLGAPFESDELAFEAAKKLDGVLDGAGARPEVPAGLSDIGKGEV